MKQKDLLKIHISVLYKLGAYYLQIIKFLKGESDEGEEMMTEIISSNFPAVLLKINAVLSSAFLCDKNCIIMFVAFVVNSEISIVPFRRELYAASFRVRYGNAFSVTGV